MKSAMKHVATASLAVLLTLSLCYIIGNALPLRFENTVALILHTPTDTHSGAASHYTDYMRFVQLMQNTTPSTGRVQVPPHLDDQDISALKSFQSDYIRHEIYRSHHDPRADLMTTPLLEQLQQLESRQLVSRQLARHIRAHIEQALTSNTVMWYTRRMPAGEIRPVAPT